MDNNVYDSLRGLFEGGNFTNTQINIIPGDGAQISYEAPVKKEIDSDENTGVRQSIMEYVNKLMPIVAEKYREDFSNIWLDIIKEDVVSNVIFNRGKQKGTVFNRNLVAHISRMMVLDGIIVKDANDVMMAELLEPQKGKNHPVRNQLGLVPDDEKIKRAVKDVFIRHGVEVE
jgi:hypothetical protein